nr:sugar ABC transporter permease [Actinomycetes bacterium]
IVAVVFRSLDALRIFDLIYILTPSNEQTITMSVFARQQQFDFNNFSYGSAASSLLFLIIAFITIGYLRVSRFDVDNR